MKKAVVVFYFTTIQISGRQADAISKRYIDSFVDSKVIRYIDINRVGLSIAFLREFNIDKQWSII